MVKNTIMEQIKVPAQLNYLRVLRKFVARIGLEYGFSAKELNAFIASVDEACTNIIEHGYGHKDGSITIKVIVKSESLIIELLDQGKSFDPNQVKDPDLAIYVDTQKKGGLGIPIMHKLLDKIEYQVTKNGNILRLIKFRQPPERQDITLPVTSIFKKLKSFLSCRY